MSAPSGRTYSSGLSIKKMLAPKEEGSDETVRDFRNMPTESYGIDDFKMAWRRYAHILKENGDKTFYNAMLKRDPVSKPNDLFVLEVDNQVQVDTIHPRLSELLGYLRKELNNYAIQVEVILTDNPETENKYQTGKDIFAAMARKNPNLHTLKKTFNLDIEF